MTQDIHSAIHGDGLADVLERILDKGVVIAGDISISLVGIELLTIRLRLLIATVDKARELGIDWWEHDPRLSSSAEPQAVAAPGVDAALAQRVSDHEARILSRGTGAGATG